METRELHDVETVRDARERFVPRGVATTDFVVARAEGASVWDADGREFLDFAGGIACQNLGHNPETVVRAVHEQVDRYLHQCFMVGMYEPYVEVCRRLGRALARRERDEDAARQLRRGGGRERGQDRPRRHRPRRGDRLRPRLPRPHEPDDGDDGEARLQAGLRAARAGGLSRACSVPVPRQSRPRTRSRASSCCSSRTSRRSLSPASCSRRCRARAASSRCPPSS